MLRSAATFSCLLGAAFAAVAQDRTAPEVPGLGAVLKAKGYVEIPLVRDKHSAWLLVDGKVNGRPVRLLLDTGASAPGLVNARRAAALKVEVTRKTAPTPFAGGHTLPTSLARLDSVELGPMRLGVQEWMVMDISQVLQSDPDDKDGLDGLIGAGLLNEYSAVIDHRGLKLYLLDPFTAAEPDLAGEWIGVELTQKGVRYGAEHAAKYRLTFADRGLKYRAPSLDIDYPRLILDTASSPRRMEWVLADGSRKFALYEFRNGRLVVAAPLLIGDRPTGWPTGFSTAADARHTVLELERAPRPKAGGGGVP